MSDPIVGHKTFSDGKGGYRHEPLRQSEAAEVRRRANEAEANRRALMPDEDSARRMLFDAWVSLKQFGWKEAMYCPKDGRIFHAIEAGSTGVHECSYSGEWPTGSYWIHSESDLWPSNPILYKPKDPQP